MTSTNQMLHKLNVNNSTPANKTKKVSDSSLANQKEIMTADTMAEVMQNCLNPSSSKKSVLGR